MALRIRLTARAVRDLQDIRDYLLLRSPQGADRVREDIDRTISTLADFPGVGHESDIAGVSVLPTIHYPFLVYHMVKRGELVVVHVRHGSRDAPSVHDVDI